MEAALAAGANPNATVKMKPDMPPVSMLEASLQYGGTGAVALLQHRANAKLPPPEGAQLLGKAIQSHYAEVVSLMLDQGIPVNAPMGDSWTLLTLACYHNDVPIVKMLIERGEKPNSMLQAAGYEGKSALHFASSQNAE